MKHIHKLIILMIAIIIAILFVIGTFCFAQAVSERMIDTGTTDKVTANTI